MQVFAEWIKHSDWSARAGRNGIEQNVRISYATQRLRSPIMDLCAARPPVRALTEEIGMSIALTPLPYAAGALAPHISAETVEYHYERHHRGYVDKLNMLIVGTPFSGMPLEDIVTTSSGAVFNNAAQAWNHTFYWNSLSPKGNCVPSTELANAIAAQFGTPDGLREHFAACATANFGSGWTWLIKHRVDDSLAILSTGNAETPLTDSTVQPLLVVDVWEHAYYIDYRNARTRYVDAFWQLANWEFASANFAV